MNFIYYSAFFHDGDLLSVNRSDTKVEFKMRSAELSPEENRDTLPLDKDNRIAGVLTVEGVQRIVVNKKPLNDVLKMKRESGEILDFKVEKGKATLGILWYDIPPKSGQSDFSAIEIYGEAISWRGT